MVIIMETYECNRCEKDIEIGSDMGPFETKDGNYVCQDCHETIKEHR